MSKALECLERMTEHLDLDDKYFYNQEKEDEEIIKNTIQRLEAIDNANPSEVLKHLNYLKAILPDWQRVNNGVDILTTIKQSLLKSQEQEKENAYIEKVKTMMKQKDCVLRYIESEECFAVKTVFSNGWYRLTPEFVDNNVREEIKPLPLIEKIRQLKEENARYKRVLDIIKEKRVDMFILESVSCASVYNVTLEKDFYKVDDYRFLTDEEFNSIKEVLK